MTGCRRISARRRFEQAVLYEIGQETGDNRDLVRVFVKF